MEFRLDVAGHTRETKAMNEAHIPELPPPWDRVFSFATRLFVWCLFFSILYFLRSFFLLIFLTFVFSYIQAHGADVLSKRIRPRGLAVALVGIAFLGIVFAIGSFVIPRVTYEANLFADNYSSYLQKIDAEIVSLSEKYPLVKNIIPAQEGREWNVKTSPSAVMAHQLFGLGGSSENGGDVNSAVSVLRNIGRELGTIASAFLLALLFSFLIVLDLPRLTRSVESLQYTRLGFIYEEVSESLKNFGRVLGKMLEAQLFIAIVNTLLTGILIYFMGIGKSLAFLSLCVFFGSFIPVAGVFFSSVPICVVVLQDQGVSGVLLAALLIWIIHLIEAYILNPRIFGRHLRVNPVLVLIILTVGGKLFHVWGLILGLPVCKYFFGHAIQYRRENEGDAEV